MAHRVSERPVSGIYLYWIPLGAGGSGFVRLNGRIYEGLMARRQRRRPLALFHTALVVELPEGRFVVETMWPRPDGDGESRGVVREGPVFSGRLSFTRVFRYEVRCWRDGELPDADQAVDGPRLVSADIEMARRALELTRVVPVHTWGREVTATGDMWNSNSVVSWVLATSGLDMEAVVAPEGGRAPGWDAGVTAAQRSEVSIERSQTGGL